MKKKKLKEKLSKTKSRLSRMVRELAEAESVIEALSLKKVGKPVESNGGGKAVPQEAQVPEEEPARSKTAAKQPVKEKKKN